jgi:predicted metal-binding membrane protein
MFAPAHLRMVRRDRAILAAAVCGLALVAWLALWAAQASPWGRFLQHDAQASGSIVVQAALFTAGWTLMIVAMMLPTSIPLIVTFGALVGRRPRPGRLVALLVAGYLAAWTGFGLGAWIADRGIHALVDAWPFLARHPQLILATTLLVAGLWQFSPLRERCLDECRSPLGFLVGRWRGIEPRREAARMGIAHGIFCIGCCWSLMLVLFGVGMGSLVLMLGLGALTAIERNMPWGRRLTRPLGVVLVVAGVAALTP